MRKPILVAGIALLFLFQANLKAQINLNWSSSFSPVWNNGNTTGSAPNVGGFGITVSASATIYGGGTFVQALGTTGALTPTVAGATFTVPGTTNRLQVTTNYTTNAGYTDIIITFTTGQATNVTFKIVDIDKASPTSTTYFDQVTVTGSRGATNYNATLSKYDNSDPNFLVISGNVAHVNTTSGLGDNTASDPTDQRGTVNVSFGTATLTSVRVRYNNATGADANPASQAIAIGSLSFNSSTLPVSLLSFNGHRQNNDVSLAWTTTQEMNSASFEIERSNGTNSWEKIGTVAAAGNSTSDRNYSFVDINAQGALLLYRLKQVDTDNNFKYSNIVRITAKNVKADMVSYPNPFASQVSINLTSSSDQSVLFNLFDTGGKTIRAGTNKLYTGNNSITIGGLDKVSTGVYYLEIKSTTGELLGRSTLWKN